MKKIILTGIVAFCGVSAAFSQDASGAPAGTKVMTVAEANRLNGVAQPTINGRPYSQYKAEQDALKQQKEAALAKRNSNGNNDGVQSEKTVQPQRNLNVQGSSVEPEVKPDAVVVNKEEAKPVAKETTQPSPFPLGAVAKPAPVLEQAISIKGTSMDPEAMPVQTVPAKPAGRTPAEIEKAKQQTEQNKVQPAAGKDIAAAQSATTPEIKVVQADGDPVASKAAEVKPPVAPSSDGKQELPAKKN